jgi:pimeloyl-ACP methyl ester carboxylesterase
MRECRFRAAAVLSTVTIGLALSSIPTNASPLDLPTVVMVHGAWADTSSWDGEIGALQSRGFQARAVANPLHDLNGDAESVATFVRSIDGPVILVGHSYGGSVISQAAQNCPNVRALVFVDAFIPEPGESAIMLNGQGSALTERPEEELFDKVPNPDGPPGVVDLLLKRNVFLEDFANDIPAERADKLWATQRATSTAAVTAPSTAAAWKTIPSWAFISTGDRIITSASKAFMAQRAGATVTTFEGGPHLSLISHPDAVVAVIESAATAVS